MRDCEARCPDCGDYCTVSPVDQRAYCPADGWFDATPRSTHTVQRPPAPTRTPPHGGTTR